VALVPDGEAAVPVLVSTVSGSGATVGGVHVHRPTLDDVFLAMTGHAADPAAKEAVHV
jgi:ABC-2 type transport system ATP-binding protein